MVINSLQQIKKCFVKQQDKSDCGVACLLGLIKYYGGQSSIEQLRNSSGTSIEGATLLGLYQAALECGFEAEGCESDISEIKALDSPLILHVINESSQTHFIIAHGCYQRNGDMCIVASDPAKGIVYFSDAELAKVWKSKSCLLLRPGPVFRKATAIKQERRNWIKELIRADAGLLITAAVLGLAIAGLGLSMALFSQKLIDNILPKKDVTRLLLGVGIVFLLLFAKEALSILRQRLMLGQSRQFNIRITSFFFHHLLRLPKTFFDTRSTGDLVARVNDTSRIQRVISQLAGNVIIEGLVSIVSLCVLVNYSFIVGMICCFTIPLFYFLLLANQKKIQYGQRNIMAAYAQVESNYISTLKGIEPIKNYNRQEEYGAINQDVYTRFQDSIFSLGKLQIKVSFISNISGIIILNSILIFVSYQVIIGQMKVGQLMAILSISGSLLSGIASLAMTVIPINEAKIAFDRMFELTLVAPEDKGGVGENRIGSFQCLSLQNISYRFPGRKQLLNKVSLTVNKGEIIAVLGENGSGKTTLMQVIQGNYTAMFGKMIINEEIVLSDYNIEDWRTIIGTVPQQVHIFNGTIYENIAFSDGISNISEVVNFLKQYGFFDFIKKFPQGGQTLVGEGAINLSGGQKQIIGLARALYHKPSLLLLDEVTASMDRNSERFVLSLLKGLRKDLAIIFITHRFNILKSLCDRIYILEDGLITNTGNHEELIATDNLYSAYWNDLV